MSQTISLRGVILFWGCLVTIGSCYALDASDIPNLKVGAVLSVADSKNEPPLREVSITHVHPVRADESVWYQINGTSGSGKEEIFYADLHATPAKLESVVRQVNLRKMVDRPRKFLDAVEEDGKGELVFDGVTFPYNDAESDDGRFEPDGNKTLAFEFNYLVFTSNKTPNLSIQVMRWDEEKFDTFLVRKISASDATLK